MSTQEKSNLAEAIFQDFNLFEQKYKQFFQSQNLRNDWIELLKLSSLKMCLISSETNESNILLSDDDKRIAYIIDGKEIHEIESNVSNIADAENYVKEFYRDKYMDSLAIDNINYSEGAFVGSYSVVWAFVNESKCSDSFLFFIKILLRFLEKAVNDLAYLNKGKEESFWIKSAEKMDFHFGAWYRNMIFEIGVIPKAELITEIAFLNYESRANKASLLFVDIDDLQSFDGTLPGLLRFDRKRQLIDGFASKKSQKSIRKMLETGCDRKSDGSYLLAQMQDPYSLFGIATNEYFKGNIDHHLSYWLIEFMGNGDWKLCTENDTLLVYSRGRFLLDVSQEKAELEDLVKKIKQIEHKKEYFLDIFKRLQNQKHGALLIIAEDAETEAQILCGKFKKGTLIEKIDFTIKENLPLLDGIASVDGAVLLDFNGVCYGFSVILDGEAKVDGDAGRGARYNSSVNYIAGKERYAIIVSEDKENGIEVEYGMNKEVKERTLEE